MVCSQGGIILGPSVLGQIDKFANTLFPLRSVMVLETMANVGILYFLFLVGVEIIHRMGRKALAIAIAGMILPFIIGVSFSFVLHQKIPGSERRHLHTLPRRCPLRDRLPRACPHPGRAQAPQFRDRPDRHVIRPHQRHLCVDPLSLSHHPSREREDFPGLPLGDPLQHRFRRLLHLRRSTSGVLDGKADPRRQNDQ